MVETNSLRVHVFLICFATFLTGSNVSAYEIKNVKDFDRLQHTADRTALAGTLGRPHVSLAEKQELIAKYIAKYGRLESILYLSIRPASDEVLILEQVCRHGEFAECNVLGRLFRDGEVIKRDDRQAARAFAQGCQGDHAEACFNLGKLSEQGSGMAKDGIKALRYFSKACRLGNAASCKKVSDLTGRVSTVDSLNVSSPLEERK